MSRTEFFPYPVATEALTLGYDLEAEHLEVGETGRILAEGVPEAATVKVALNVTVEDGALDRVLPVDERYEPPVGIVVAVRSITARERSAVRLSQSDGLWRGVLDVPKQQLYGEVTLEPMLIRTAPGDDTEYAAHVGALIASGHAVTLEIDEPSVPPGGFIEIKFDNFRESASPKRSARPELLYMLDTDRETPILWLNEGIDEFKTVMLAKGPRGYNLRVRDAMFDSIVSQVWTSLASLALTNLALVIQEQREAEDDSDPIDALPEWHQRVISFWAPLLFGGSRAEAMEEIVTVASDRRLLPDIFDRLSAAVQKWAGTDRSFRGLIRLRDREGV